MNNIKLPKNWNDVRVDQFILLKEMDETSPSIFYRYIEMLSIFTDTLPDDKLWEDMPIEELTKLINDLLWLRLEPSNQFKKEINKLNCIDIDKIKFGEFIDLEYYFKDDYIKNLPIICSILFKKTKLNEWSDLIFEPYEYDVIERSHQFETISITDVYGIISYYLEFKQKIQTSYTSIFEPIIDDDEEDYEMNENEEIHMDYTDAFKEDVDIYTKKEQNKRSLSDEDLEAKINGIGE